MNFFFFSNLGNSFHLFNMIFNLIFYFHNIFFNKSISVLSWFKLNNNKNSSIIFPYTLNSFYRHVKQRVLSIYHHTTSFPKPNHLKFFYNAIQLWYKLNTNYNVLQVRKLYLRKRNNALDHVFRKWILFQLLFVPSRSS